MKRVIKMSKAWIAAFALGMLLAGCGGGSSDTASTGSSSQGTVHENVVPVVPGEPAIPAIPLEPAIPVVPADPVAVLSWSAPSTRVNGEGIAMGELDKYVIRYGKNKDNLNQEIVVEDAARNANMSYTVNGLGAGNWFFTIQVQDNKGLISEPSEIVSKQIRV
ncbi:MAG TPA: fibronectin type III domain-containing protein [Marinobacter sp.]|nr:fibronectin type III domain-containing protein [Marinobacter sp.]